jgi:hypothetical protein
MVHAAFVAAMLAAPPLEADIRAVAALAGEPRIVSAAGVTRDEAPVLTLENLSAFDPADGRRRVVLVGGPGGDAQAVIEAVRWFKTRAPRAIRQRWALSALPSANFEDSDKQSLARWVRFQAPDLLVSIGSLPGDATPHEGIPVADTAVHVDRETIAVADAPQAFAKLLAAPRERSALHTMMLARVQREPLAIARVLARRYPEAPSISYIPALAWVETLRLADIDKDESLRQKVIAQTRPWVDGEKTLFGDRIQLTAVAGTIVFDDLRRASELGKGSASEPSKGSASLSGERIAALFDEGASAAAKEKAPAEPEYGQGWTDDMFMATSVLARSGARPGRERDMDAAARLLTTYATRLQQPNGLFNHAINGPAAWGRGNGFAALGLVATLTRMPASHSSRARLLDIYRRQMAGVRASQAPDGAWRQIIDEPGAYREETATAMLLSAMARGIRLGWLDASYRPSVDRAWRALAAHVVDDGTLVDVCTGTGAGPTRRYYFDRPAITGADDRGGAMGLLAALEMLELRIKN